MARWHLMPRIVSLNAIPAGGLSMRIVSGIALALLMSPASGETLVERGAYASMTALDLDAMVAFLRTLPPRN
jgi:hypothetical protein